MTRLDQEGLDAALATICTQARKSGWRNPPRVFTIERSRPAPHCQIVTVGVLRLHPIMFAIGPELFAEAARRYAAELANRDATDMFSAIPAEGDLAALVVCAENMDEDLGQMFRIFLTLEATGAVHLHRTRPGSKDIEVWPEGWGTNDGPVLIIALRDLILGTADRHEALAAKIDRPALESLSGENTDWNAALARLTETEPRKGEGK